MGAILGVVLVVVAVAGTGIGFGIAALSGPSGPPMQSLEILGGPVVAGGKILVVNVTSSKELRLSAIDPSSHDVVWSRPFSASDITGGQSFPPDTSGNIVIDLRPTGAADNSSVSVEGLDIATGNVVWTYKEVGTALDAPAPCGPAGAFCLSWSSASTTGLIEVTASSGRLIRSIGGIERELGTNLYQTQDDTPTLAQIGSAGQVLWVKPSAAIFGPVNDDPSGGWDIDVHSPLDVGSLGTTPNPSGQPAPISLGTMTATGFSLATGSPVWTKPGSYNCGGTLEFLSAPVLCELAGTESPPSTPGGPPTFSGVSAALDGFDVQTGAVTWSQPVESYAGLLGSGAIPFLDGSHLVVEQNGKPVVLDTATGHVAPVGAGQVFWCASIPIVKVITPTGAYLKGMRAGTTQYFGCSAAGTAVTRLPSTRPSVVGVTIGGSFVWPAKHGLSFEPAS
jgi:hypothetical protein